jgi:hypothetical protein
LLLLTSVDGNDALVGPIRPPLAAGVPTRALTSPARGGEDRESTRLGSRP